MNVAQCKMARAGLDMTAAQLAQVAGVSVRSVMRFEAGEAVKPETVDALARALVGAGASFMETNGKRGVLLDE